MDEPKLSRVAHRAYRDIERYLDDLFGAYRTLYPGIEEIASEHELEDEHSFQYCEERKYFVLVVPYTAQKLLLVERTFHADKISWELIGGSVRRDLEETFVDAAARHAERVIPTIQLGEIEPLAFLRNTFSYGGASVEHHGLAFAARVRNTYPMRERKQAIHSRGFFIPHSDDAPAFSLTHNRQVVEKARGYLNELNVDEAPELEVAENLKYRRRYRLHDRLIKPLFRHAPTGPFEHSLDEVDGEIVKWLQPDKAERILDVACGDNTLLVDLAGKQDVPLVVTNDVSWSQVAQLNDQLRSGPYRNRESLVVFTNHDARRLPFGDKFFDAALCKNTLHHMPDTTSVAALIDETLRVARKALVMDILDPKYESPWGRLRHQYYMRVLHDAGEHFLSREAFEALTDRPGLTNRFEMQTVRGIYQVALFQSETTTTATELSRAGGASSD